MEIYYGFSFPGNSGRFSVGRAVELRKSKEKRSKSFSVSLRNRQGIEMGGLSETRTAKEYIVIYVYDDQVVYIEKNPQGLLIANVGNCGI